MQGKHEQALPVYIFNIVILYCYSVYAIGQERSCEHHQILMVLTATLGPIAYALSVCPSDALSWAHATSINEEKQSKAGQSTEYTYTHLQQLV